VVIAWAGATPVKGVILRPDQPGPEWPGCAPSNHWRPLIYQKKITEGLGCPRSHPLRPLCFSKPIAALISPLPIYSGMGLPRILVTALFCRRCSEPHLSALPAPAVAVNFNSYHIQEIMTESDSGKARAWHFDCKFLSFNYNMGIGVLLPFYLKIRFQSRALFIKWFNSYLLATFEVWICSYWSQPSDLELVLVLKRHLWTETEPTLLCSVLLL
jgi:hypothetical protein